MPTIMFDRQGEIDVSYQIEYHAILLAYSHINHYDFKQVKAHHHLLERPSFQRHINIVAMKFAPMIGDVSAPQHIKTHNIR